MIFIKIPYSAPGDYPTVPADYFAVGTLGFQYKLGGSLAIRSESTRNCAKDGGFIMMPKTTEEMQFAVDFAGT